jgi:hypothetical protein
MLATTSGDAQEKDNTMKQQVFYHSVTVDGLSIFYREAGGKTLRPFFAARSSVLVADVSAAIDTAWWTATIWLVPDYLGFDSDWPDLKKFRLHLRPHCFRIDGFRQASGLSHYTLYMQDYGGPVGFRMALAHRAGASSDRPGCGRSQQGLGANWATRRAFWADRPAHEEALRKNLLRWQPRRRAISEAIRRLSHDPDL